MKKMQQISKIRDKKIPKKLLFQLDVQDLKKMIQTFKMFKKICEF